MVGLYRAGSQKGFILCILRLVTLLLRGDSAILTAAGISAVLTGMVFRRRQLNNMLVAEGIDANAIHGGFCGHAI